MLQDGSPLFVQLAERIESGILDGSYPEESQVPSTNEFAAFLRINPATAGRGLTLLVDRGLLYKKRGIGMFVASGSRARLVEERRQAFATEYLAPMMREAQRLGLTEADVVDLIRKGIQS